MRRYSPDCPWAFKSPECGYAGPEEMCDKTPARCCEFGNRDRFGGFSDLPKIEGKTFRWGSLTIGPEHFQAPKEVKPLG